MNSFRGYIEEFLVRVGTQSDFFLKTRQNNFLIFFCHNFVCGKISQFSTWWLMKRINILWENLLSLKQCRAIHAPRESCWALRKISGIYKKTILLIWTNTLDSEKSHLQTKKFELRRESLKKILVRRGWKKSARHWFKILKSFNFSSWSKQKKVKKPINIFHGPFITQLDFWKLTLRWNFDRFHKQTFSTPQGLDFK